MNESGDFLQRLVFLYQELFKLETQSRFLLNTQRTKYSVLLLLLPMNLGMDNLQSTFETQLELVKNTHTIQKRFRYSKSYNN